VIERDNNQGTAAADKRIYLIDLRKFAPDGTLEKTLVLDLMNIDDPAGISLPGRPVTSGSGRRSRSRT
jgi:hypothetical protein